MDKPMGLTRSVAPGRWVDLRLTHRRESETWGAVTEDDYPQGRARYYVLTEQLDAQIGRLFDRQSFELNRPGCRT